MTSPPPLGGARAALARVETLCAEWDELPLDLLERQEVVDTIRFVLYEYDPDEYA